jgi:hypothetical protein
MSGTKNAISNSNNARFLDSYQVFILLALSPRVNKRFSENELKIKRDHQSKKLFLEERSTLSRREQAHSCSTS